MPAAVSLPAASFRQLRFCQIPLILTVGIFRDRVMIVVGQDR